MKRKIDEHQVSLEIFQALMDTGIPANILGYRYLKKALMMAVEDPDVVLKPKERIYQPLANEHRCTASDVQQAIRRAITVGKDRSKPEVLQQYCDYTDKVPKSGEYIAQVAEKICIRLGIDTQAESNTQISV